MKKENMDLLTTNLSLLLNRDIQVTVAGIYANVSFIPLVFKLYNMHHVYNNSKSFFPDNLLLYINKEIQE